MQSYVSDIQITYTKSGLERYFVIVEHRGLGMLQEIKGSDPNIVWAKAQGKASQWNERWAKKLAAEKTKRERHAQAADLEAKIQLAGRRTAEALVAWNDLAAVLAHTLNIDDTIDWDTLKDRSRFKGKKPTPRNPPAPPQQPNFRAEPYPANPIYQDSPGFFDKIMDLFAPQRKTQRTDALRAMFERDHAVWAAGVSQQQQQYQAELESVQKIHDEMLMEHKANFARWEQEKADFHEDRKARNAAVDEDKRRYGEGEPEAVLDYCELVLSNSQYPEWCPKDWRIDYDPESKLLIVEYMLPNLDDVPRLKTVKYVKSRNEFTESSYSDAQVRKAYDSLLYQLALRTIHELLEADVVVALDVVAFNGRVRSMDPATGHEINACVMSLQVLRDEFLAINLGAVDPKACFRKLKGVGSSQLHSLTPVAPIVQIRTDDARFVDSYEVASRLDEGENLAAMDWEDFEHLVREVFEREFSGSGGEVRVTRASRDGGIDAVAFDPDPIRGGKIVIQAKRYTRTVGVSAVRDLYGTVMNEGANKGILVSTATYGPDAYAFVRDKPLTLVDGGSLLHLMQKHGHKVRIDLIEARAEQKE